MDAQQVLAFRLARSGLAERSAPDLAAAAACPASDFSRDAALLALAARADGVTREGYDAAVDAGDVVVAHVVRGAIHALAPGDLALFGRALLRPRRRRARRADGPPGPAARRRARVCGGRRARRGRGRHGRRAEGGRALDRTELHEALRARVRAELMPWCRGCKSHHVAPMLWRYGTVAAGVRLDAARRYRLTKPGRKPAAREAVRRYLRWYGPATPAGFADWAGLARPHARRLWDEVADELAEVRVGKADAWLLAEDADAAASPPAAHGIRLLPPGDPYLQLPNRPLLAPDAGLRKRLFRPVASPGAVLHDGRLRGLWRVKAKGEARSVEALGRLPRKALERRPSGSRSCADSGLALVLD